jgi:heme exporter protein C
VAIFSQTGFPKWFFGISTRFMPWLLVGGILLLMAGAVWGLAFAPKDYLQPESVTLLEYSRQSLG